MATQFGGDDGITTTLAAKLTTLSETTEVKEDDGSTTANGQFFEEAGALKYKQLDGTVVTIALSA